MSTVILNFEKREVVADNREAAVEMIEKDLFHVNGDATQAYKNWKAKQESVTERDLKEFLIDYLAKKGKNCPGAGYTITLDPAVTDTRERPWTIVNVKNEKGTRKPSKIYKWINEEDGTVVATSKLNKADAITQFKAAVSGGFHGKANLEVSWEVKDPEQRIVAKGAYTPSKGTKKGVYLAFGIKN